MSNVNQRLFDASVVHAIALQVNVYDLQASIADRLALSDAATALALTEASSLRSRAQIGQLLATVATIRRSAFDEVDTMAKIGLIDIGLRASEMLARDFNIIAGQLATTPDNLDLARLLNKEPMLGTLYREWLSTIQTSDYNQVRAQLRIGLVEQRTALEVLQSIQGTQRLNYRDGVLIKAKRSVAQLVATAANLITNLSRFEVMKSAMVHEWRFAQVLDDHTSTTCTATDGGTYEIGKGPRPPLHIGCRAIVVPIVGGGGDVLPPETLNQWRSRQGIEPE